MGLNMKEKKALLDELTRLTGYHRKSAVRLLCAKPVKQVMLYTGDKAEKLKRISPATIDRCLIKDT